MTHDEIVRTQSRVGTLPDGFWGPKSNAACQRYLRNMMPSPHPFPLQDQVTHFYGQHGNQNYSPPTKEIRLPFPIYYEGRRVDVLRPHEKCAASLLRVFVRLHSQFPDEAARRKAGITIYDGLYNPRPMRGGTAWSMHSWAIAIDFNAEDNMNNQHWPTSAVMPIEVMECFAQEGWTAAGAFWNRDAMHFQATNPD